MYRVLLRGENFLVNLTGEPELLGFHVTHFVKAAAEEEAQQIAIIRTRKDPYLTGVLMNTRENPTRLEAEAIDRVYWPFWRKSGRYTFWEMKAPLSTGQDDR
ncbi:hypothetical protein [Alkalilimnicola ehrlichii]|uniref:hypothetical protein n=1 Tax=Alkalilimnicola ehrlichii TaxID=351052 RepID=UPI0011C028A4|nr:hypothetical protein [Alkalilimnicola ehrlichii]